MYVLTSGYVLIAIAILDGNLLQCMPHGAAYTPDTGLCTWGPCEGLSLIRLNIVEQEDCIYLQDDKYNLIDD
ncbi:MAG: nitrite reductase/ring-hydroxylating ferredoxin subunit [Planctomycetota bacterium]|jgi:nitrite reductase/ring-hydroxylating ferredoxin subunit